MQTLAQPAPPVRVQPQAPLVEIGTAQHLCLMRWHQRACLGDVQDNLRRHGHWPLIDCNPNARAFAPARSAPTAGGAA